MNIEGSEWEILGDPRMADTAVCWIVDYHGFANPSPTATNSCRRSGSIAPASRRGARANAFNGLLWV